MTTDRADRMVATWLAATAQPTVPDYFDDLLTQTARTRQRPAWSFLGRWIPMAVITRTPPWASAAPLRLVLVLALVALLAVLAVVGGGPGPRRLPPPFGIAGNGSIVVAQPTGQLILVDPTDGSRRLFLETPGIGGVTVSRDGTRIAYITDADGSPFVYRWDVHVVDVAGGAPTRINPTPLEDLDGVSFSPDGRSLLLLSAGSMWIGASDGTGLTRLEVGMTVSSAAFRPTDADQIAFARSDGPRGIYLTDLAGSTPQPLWIGPGTHEVAAVGWSPDGQLISFSSWDQTILEMSARVHLIAPDGTGHRVLAPGSESGWEADTAWSNAGDRAALLRGHERGAREVFLVIADVASGATVVTQEPVGGGCCPGLEWAPDDTAILVTPIDPTLKPQPQLLVDPVTGAVRPLPGAQAGWSGWQRLAVDAGG